jgi:hypothetical protein
MTVVVVPALSFIYSIDKEVSSNVVLTSEVEVVYKSRKQYCFYSLTCNQFLSFHKLRL